MLEFYQKHSGLVGKKIKGEQIDWNSLMWSQPELSRLARLILGLPPSGSSWEYEKGGRGVCDFRFIPKYFFFNDFVPQ